MVLREGNLLASDPPRRLVFLRVMFGPSRMLLMLFFLVSTFREPLRFFIERYSSRFYTCRSTEQTGTGLKRQYSDGLDSNLSISALETALGRVTV